MNVLVSRSHLKVHYVRFFVENMKKVSTELEKLTVSML